MDQSRRSSSGRLDAANSDGYRRTRDLRAKQMTMLLVKMIGGDRDGQEWSLDIDRCKHGNLVQVPAIPSVSALNFDPSIVEPVPINVLIYRVLRLANKDRQFFILVGSEWSDSHALEHLINSYRASS